MPSKTPSPYRRPWSNTETTALPRSYHVPSIHTMEGIGGICLLSPAVTTGGRGPGGRRVYEAAGGRTQDLRIKSPLLYQLSYRLLVTTNSSNISRRTPSKLTPSKRKSSKRKPFKGRQA